MATSPLDVLPFQSTPLIRGETEGLLSALLKLIISIHSPHTRGDGRRISLYTASIYISIRSPLTRGDRQEHGDHGSGRISTHSPHARGDSISLQKSIRIYVSLHNKTMIHRFSELYKPLFAAQSPIFGVRNPRKSRDSFTFARPSDGHGITP